MRLSNSTERVTACAHASFEGVTKSETCTICGERYPAAWLPSWSMTGQAQKIRTAYCSERCRKEGKRRIHAASKARAAERIEKNTKEPAGQAGIKEFYA